MSACSVHVPWASLLRKSKEELTTSGAWERPCERGVLLGADVREDRDPDDHVGSVRRFTPHIGENQLGFPSPRRYTAFKRCESFHRHTACRQKRT